ncbi:hypothetical protein EVAR_92696_1 [Eumeta japonica]|uniref:Uncharacterized protein n=1 Tax=Eumeta variegata TaxID=151549 RepID=A0A4C1SZR2_EUMVA|nr:hypothetical protein EVAR_92696_1 [Eumeta japonica]
MCTRCDKCCFARCRPDIALTSSFPCPYYELYKLAPTQDYPGVYDYLRRLLANHRNTVFAKLLTTPGVLSARIQRRNVQRARAREARV